MNTVLVRQASLFTQLVAVAPKFEAVLMKLQRISLERHPSGVLAVHPQSLCQLVFVHRGGVVVGEVGLVSTVSQWESFLTPVLRELRISIQETLQSLHLALDFSGQLGYFFFCVINKDLVESGGDLHPFGVGWKLKVRWLRVASDAVVKSLLGQHELYVLPEELLQTAIHQLTAHRHAAEVTAEAGLPR